MKILSLFFCASAIALAVGWYWLVSQYGNPIAADIPIELTAGRTYSIPVSAGFSYNYAMEIVFVRRLNTHLFACLTGGLNEEAVRERQCGSLNPTLRLAWSVSAHRTLIAHGISREPLSFVVNSDTIASTIAVFGLKKGNSYILNTRVLSDAGPLSSLSPRIMIVATTDYAEGPGLFTDLILLVLIILLIGAALSYVADRRRASAQAP